MHSDRTLCHPDRTVLEAKQATTTYSQNEPPFPIRHLQSTSLLFFKKKLPQIFTMGRPDGPRDPIAGPDTPQPPFPLKLRGPVIKGFGRGSKEVTSLTPSQPLN